MRHSCIERHRKNRRAVVGVVCVVAFLLVVCTQSPAPAPKSALSTATEMLVRYETGNEVVSVPEFRVLNATHQKALFDFADMPHSGWSQCASPLRILMVRLGPASLGSNIIRGTLVARSLARQGHSVSELGHEAFVAGQADHTHPDFCIVCRSWPQEYSSKRMASGEIARKCRQLGGRLVWDQIDAPERENAAVLNGFGADIVLVGGPTHRDRVKALVPNTVTVLTYIHPHTNLRNIKVDIEDVTRRLRAFKAAADANEPPLTSVAPIRIAYTSSPNNDYRWDYTSAVFRTVKFKRDTHGAARFHGNIAGELRSAASKTFISSGRVPFTPEELVSMDAIEQKQVSIHETYRNVDLSFIWQVPVSESGDTRPTSRPSAWMSHGIPFVCFPYAIYRDFLTAIGLADELLAEGTTYHHLIVKLVRLINNPDMYYRAATVELDVARFLSLDTTSAMLAHHLCTYRDKHKS